MTYDVTGMIVITHISLYKSELPSLIFTNFCLHYLHNALDKKTKKMIGHRVSFRTTDGQSL